MTSRVGRALRTTRCAARPLDRLLRGVGAGFVAAVAVSLWPNAWCAVPAAICAVLLAIGAITGWCPDDLLRMGRDVEPNALGYPEARQPLLEEAGARR
ncbi:YgaP family membrane protein [Agromyces sp. SYSU T00194]|uniref:YgaP family membrane protein n=1 Tax=Agromyces chitinivorans TaxID=3158560 RepID=UPI00339500C4